jgi:hypothetical protein
LTAPLGAHYLCVDSRTKNRKNGFIFPIRIIRLAIEKYLKVIYLRSVCTDAGDYANEIEPSSRGGAKIAGAIVRAVTEPSLSLRGAYVEDGLKHGRHFINTKGD